MDWAAKRVLVLGLGETGLSMARWLRGQGAAVRAADTRNAPPALAQVRREFPELEVHCGGFPQSIFSGVDLIAISPGVPLAEPAVRQALARGTPVVGDIELFAQALRDGEIGAQALRDGEIGAQALRDGEIGAQALRDREIGAQALRGAPAAAVLAVTGTNGKTTVTALAGAMCRAAGLDCETAGNIGPAALDALARCQAAGRRPAAWVLELSSFQLETTHSLEPAAAAMLNLTEDHLDRYASIADYGAAKARIFLGGGTQVLNRDDPRSLAMAIAGRPVLTFGLDAPPSPRDFGLIERGGATWLAQGGSALIATGELKIAGLHNAANALAALALCSALGLPLAPLVGALREFRGLPHRVELAAEVAGVAFYDDSKGTNVGATVAALAGFVHLERRGGAKVVLLAGGEGKSQDFSPLRGAVAKAARGVVLIGRDAPLIEKALAGCGVPVQRAGDMDEAVALAAAAARPGDVVLLSPACASFDLFRDYKHRGDAFRDCVLRLGHAKPQ